MPVLCFAPCLHCVNTTRTSLRLTLRAERWGRYSYLHSMGGKIKIQKEYKTQTVYTASNDQNQNSN